MSNKEKLDKVKRQIFAKSFSSKSQTEKEILLETYVESAVKVKETESKRLELEMKAQDKEREERKHHHELEMKDKEKARKHKRFIIKAIITFVTIFLEIIVLVLFLNYPSELGVKAFDLGLVAISGLIAVLFGVKKEKND